MNVADVVENRTYDELSIGECASVTRTVTPDDVQLFAAVSGDVNPAHLDPEYAATDIFHRVIVHGMWGAGLISSLLGVRLPGPGTIYLEQSLRFEKPVGIGDTITASVRVTEKRDKSHIVVLDTRCVNQRGEEVIGGQAVVRAPTEKVRRPRPAAPDLRIIRHERFRQAIDAAKAGPPVPTAVVHPCDDAAMAAAAQAASFGLIEPILVGPDREIRAAAEAAGVDIASFRCEHAPCSGAAAARGVQLVRSAEAQLLIKGSLDADELLSAVLDSRSGLRTGRRISHVYLMDVPGYPRPLLITDAAINIAPDLSAKRDIVQNAIDLARILGLQRPKVAILSAVETVKERLASTLDAAALCKMAERGQITGGVLDGPLAMDNAVSPEAATQKRISSPVAGDADILVAPDLEAANILAKQFTFLGGADAAGIVVGARAPIILTSRADSERTRLLSCAVGVLLARVTVRGRHSAA